MHGGDDQMHGGDDQMHGGEGRDDQIALTA